MAQDLTCRRFGAETVIDRRRDRSVQPRPGKIVPAGSHKQLMSKRFEPLDPSGLNMFGCQRCPPLLF